VKRKLMSLLFILLFASFGLLGCSSADPLPEPFYTSDLTVVDGYSLQREDGYWRNSGHNAINLYSTEGTRLNPNISSLGGYRLDAIAEYIYFTVLGGNAGDVVLFQLECWHKVEGEPGCTVYSLEGSTVVGISDQHDLFKQTIVVSNIRVNEIISFRINLNTILSDVVNVIVNYVEFKCPTLYPAEEK